MRAIITALALAASPAAASGTWCLPTSEMTSVLAYEFNEHQIAIGMMTGDGAIISVFASASGTFTIVGSNPNGKSCVLVHGNSFMFFADFKGVPG
jgi:hypothetical protein